MNEYKPAYGMTLLWMWVVMTLVVFPFALVGDVVAALTGHTSLGQILGAFLLAMLLFELLSILLLLAVNLIIRRFSSKSVFLYEDHVSYEGKRLSLDTIRYVSVHLPQMQGRTNSTPLYLVLWADNQNYLDIKRPSPELILAMKKCCPHARFSVDDWRGRWKQIVWLWLGIFVVLAAIVIYALFSK